MNAKAITDLVWTRHTDDIFVPECKDGSSVMRAKSLRLDAWAMKRSYSRPCMTGYEIKVSRGDFINDTKMQHYLPLCNVFYVVAAHGICDKSEVPEQAGLLEVSKGGSRLFTRKKAPHRTIDFPEHLIRYILYSRTKIVAPGYNNAESPTDILKKARYGQLLAHQINGKLKRLVAEKIDLVAEENHKLQQENERLKERIHQLETLESVAKELGVSDMRWMSRDRAKTQLSKLLSGVPPELEFSVKSAQSCLETFLTHLNTIKENNGLSKH